MSDLELLQKEAAKKAYEYTGETDPNAAKTDKWFGFYYGYILGKQEKQANFVDTDRKQLNMTDFRQLLINAYKDGFKTAADILQGAYESIEKKKFSNCSYDKCDA
jgi:hypothetical protein